MKEMMVSSSLAMLCGAALASAPVVTVVDVTQDPSTRAVTVVYDLTEENAVVTFGAQTNNGTAWIDIGNRHLSHFSGDVNRLVEKGDGHRIVWHPDKSWPGQKILDGTFRIGLKAWATNAPPPYMVIDLTMPGASARYYEDDEALPYPATDDLCKTDLLVMRKMPSAGVEWRMGQAPGELPAKVAEEQAHRVSFTKDYYIGIYPLTHRQYARMKSEPGTEATWRLPLGGITPDAFGTDLSSFNTRFALALRLPTEAEWEYACRAGTGTAYNNGTDGTSLDNLGTFAWYNDNAARSRQDVGQLAENAWGLYDMHGNVWEFCSDTYASDYGGISTEPVIDPVGKTPAGTSLVLKGGWSGSGSADIRSAARTSASKTASNLAWGFRLACEAQALK